MSERLSVNPTNVKNRYYLYDDLVSICSKIYICTKINVTHIKILIQINQYTIEIQI